MSVGDLGAKKIPPERLRRRYDFEEILGKVNEQLEKVALKAYELGKNYRVYCILHLPVDKNEPRLLGDFFTKLHEITPSTVKPIELPFRKWKAKTKIFNVYRVGYEADPENLDDLQMSLEILMESENLNYLPFIGVDVGIHSERVDRFTKDVNLRFSPFPIKIDERGEAVYEMRFKRKKYKPPFEKYLDFMHYYLIVVDVMDKMFIKELYENRNLAVSRVSGGLVWVRRTKEGKDIRVKRKEDLLKLVEWGGFEFFLEDSKCKMEESRCRVCDVGCSPNVIFDLDPGKKVSRKKIVDTIKLIQQNLEDEGLFYIIKYTGGRGYNIDVYVEDLKLPEPYKYIPLKVLKHHQQMSVKRLKQVIEEMSKDKAGIVRDYLRMKTDYLRNRSGFGFLVHDMSMNAWRYDSLTVDASSIKRRSYHRAFYSLTSRRTICLPVCQSGDKFNWNLETRAKEISKDYENILKYEKELMDVKIKFNDPTFVKDFIEEYERKIYRDEFKECSRRLGI